MSAARDLTGMRFGQLVAIARAGRAPDRSALWECRCEFGRLHVLSSRRLFSTPNRVCDCRARDAEEAAKVRHAAWETTSRPVDVDRRGTFVSTRRGLIYFVQGVDGGPIKIGFTVHRVKHRLAELQCGSPITLRVLATAETTAPFERDLHVRFDAYRLHGEWFRPSDELLSFIAELVADPLFLSADAASGPSPIATLNSCSGQSSHGEPL